MAHDRILEFKEVVKHFDITPRTLRYYEYLELIAPIREGRKRFYTKREMARIELILRGRKFGFKLEDIRQLLELYDPQSGNVLQTQKAIERAEAQLSELKTRRSELEKTIVELQDNIEAGRRYLNNVSKS